MDGSGGEYFPIQDYSITLCHKGISMSDATRLREKNLDVNLYVVMGVTGCGKSTVARALAQKSSGVFLDADDFHSKANLPHLRNPPSRS